MQERDHVNQVDARQKAAPTARVDALDLLRGVVALLYPPCVWFAGVKRRHHWAWLSYF
jgi:hypothetical protein